MWARGDDGTYVAEARGTRWHLALVDDGVLPGGWRLQREGQRSARPVAAAGRPVAFVLQQATSIVLKA